MDSGGIIVSRERKLREICKVKPYAGNPVIAEQGDSFICRDRGCAEAQRAEGEEGSTHPERPRGREKPRGHEPAGLPFSRVERWPKRHVRGGRERQFSGHVSMGRQGRRRCRLGGLSLMAG